MADTESTETVEEREEAAETVATPEEAHREGEFDDVISRIEALSEVMNKTLDAVTAMRESMSSFVAEGATVREEDHTEITPDESDLAEAIEDMDFSLDEE